MINLFSKQRKIGFSVQVRKDNEITNEYVF